MKATMNRMDLEMELFFKKQEETYTKRREELENELSKVFNESVAEGKLIEDEAQELLEALCEARIIAGRVFNIIIGEEEDNNLESEKEVTDHLKQIFKEAIDRGNSIESEVRQMIEAIGLYSSDTVIMMDYVVEKDLGLDVAMKVFFATI